MNLIAKILLTTLCSVVFSCAYDNAEELYGETDCPPGGTSFDQKVAPIISSNCAVSGCHVNGQQSPALETYEQIAASASRVKARTSNGTMPPATSMFSLTQQEIDDIACWVDAGAPNN